VHPIAHALLAVAAWTLLASALAAAEPDDGAAPSGVPDPYGLGERLALVDWLREHRLPVADPGDLAALRRSYRAVTVPGPDDRADERRTLAFALWKRHGVAASDDASLADLRAQLAELDRRRAAAPPPPSGGGVTVLAPDPRQRPPSDAPPEGPPPGAEPGQRPPPPPLPPAAPGERIPAPVVQFSALVWRVPGPNGGTWRAGDGSQAFPRTLGGIAEPAPDGTQILVWKERGFVIQSCARLVDGAYQISFPAGLLHLTMIDARHCEVAFMEAGASATRTFQTGL
jgi:hypothetical protein